MVCEPVQAAKRALVSVICTLARVYGVQVACRRDSPDEVVLKDFRRLVLKTHPDRGGVAEHQQQLMMRGWLRTQRGSQRRRARQVTVAVALFLHPPGLLETETSSASKPVQFY